MVDVISTRATILEHLTKDNLLSRYYEQAMGIGHFSDYLASVVEQIVHRYPQMKVLEIGRHFTFDLTTDTNTFLCAQVLVLVWPPRR